MFHLRPYSAMDYFKSLASKVFFLVGKVHCREIKAWQLDYTRMLYNYNAVCNG